VERRTQPANTSRKTISSDYRTTPPGTQWAD